MRRVWGPFPAWESVPWGQWQLPAVHLNWSASGAEKTWGENHLALCLHGDQAFSKRGNSGVLQCVPDAGERSKNRLWRFSHLVHPFGSAFPGSCQTRTFGMAFCRCFSGSQNLGCI